MQKLIQWFRNLFKKTEPIPLPIIIIPPPEIDQTPWYSIAAKELGIKELWGDANNPRILEYHKATTLKATDDETSWCSAFVCWCLEQAGLQSTKSAVARSYLDWGIKLDEPREGCIVVFKRGSSSWQGHVAFLVREEGEYIVCLGGNQSNAVSIAKYAKKDLLGFRWPKEKGDNK